MSAPGDPARAALALRLGPRARQDAAGAPAADLALARAGTAYVARLLNDLPDAALGGASLRPDWTRAALFAALSCQARALARLVEGARTGICPATPGAGASAAEIALGATLPPRALRHLVSHAAIHLNVEWRDLDDAGWTRVVADGRGARFPLRQHRTSGPSRCGRRRWSLTPAAVYATSRPRSETRWPSGPEPFPKGLRRREEDPPARGPAAGDGWRGR